MEHKEFKRISDDADTAVLFVHGIIGTPNHFNEFVPLVPERVSVYNILLDGHGKEVQAFSKTSIKIWEAQVASAVEELSLSHKKIYVVAYSLGSLLAIEQATKSEKVCNLFLLSAPLKLSIKPKMFDNVIKVYIDRIRPDDYEGLAAKNCYGIKHDKNLLHYIGWIPRFLELFKKTRQTRKIMDLVHVNCVVYHSSKDEVVSKRSLKYLENNPYISVKELKNSGHCYYDKEDFNFLIAEFKEMLNNMDA